MTYGTPTAAPSATANRAIAKSSSLASRGIELTMRSPTAISERSRTRPGGRMPASAVFVDPPPRAAVAASARSHRTAAATPANRSAQPSQGSRTTKNAGAARHTSKAGSRLQDQARWVATGARAGSAGMSAVQWVGDLVLRHLRGDDGDQAEQERDDARDEEDHRDGHDLGDGSGDRHRQRHQCE